MRSSFSWAPRVAGATILLAAALVFGCTRAPIPTPSPATKSAEEWVADSAEDDATKVSAGPTSTPRPLATGIKVEPVADGLQLPANLAFAPDGRLFLTEVNRGTVRVIENGQLLPDPVATLEVANDGEQGLLGLTLDPDFAGNHFMYVFYSEPRDGKGLRQRVVRLTEAGNRASEMRVVLDDLPINNTFHNASHNGGRVAFGSDGKLYVTVGDIGRSTSAQDKGKLAGKLLRINPDGTIPADNPFPGSPVYALGLRNSYGVTFHPATGVPYVTDNGPVGRDEVDRIKPGGNYGSPEVNGIRNNSRFVDPIWESHADRGGISGITFYTGSLFPEYRGDLLFCTFTSGRMLRLRLGGADFDRVVSDDLLTDQCNLDVVTGPDGAIYFSSINRVQRLVPVR